MSAPGGPSAHRDRAVSVPSGRIRGARFEPSETRRWAGPAFVVLLAVTLPLLCPPALRAGGWVPDLAVLAIVYVGCRGTTDRAAMLGVVLGLAASLWSPEPLCFRPFVLGAVGWTVAQAASVLHRDHSLVRMAAAALAVACVRVAEHLAAAIAGRGGAPWTAAESRAAVVAAVVAAGITALAAPSWFALVSRLRLLTALERSRRDV